MLPEPVAKEGNELSHISTSWTNRFLHPMRVGNMRELETGRARNIVLLSTTPISTSTYGAAAPETANLDSIAQKS